MAKAQVVYHLVPTSNHNGNSKRNLKAQLFIILFLHQTTTSQTFTLPIIRCLSSCSYIKPQHLARPGSMRKGCLSSCSYIKPQLGSQVHQTQECCLSSCSYIKPQQCRLCNFVYLWLFIILFLHQTTTVVVFCSAVMRCLSSCSYIKPQPIVVNLLVISKILRFGLLRNGRAGRFLLQIY